MALLHADFVEETTTTTGTGTLSLAGATTGHRTFVSAIGDGNTCIYAIAASDGNFESGIGTVADASPDTLARTTLLSSSTGAKLDLPAGTHRVYCTFAAAGGAKAYGAEPALGSPGTTGYVLSSTDAGARSWVARAATGVVREFYVDAGAMVPRKTAGASPYTEEYATNDVMVDYYLFDGGATEEGVQFKLAMPDAWDRGTIKAKFFWDAATGASASDGVTWGISARAVSNDDAVDAAFAASVDTDDVVIAVGDLHVTAASAAITVSGTPALGDLILFEITRVTADAQDDMAEDAKLFGIQIQYTESTTAPSAW